MEVPALDLHRVQLVVADSEPLLVGAFVEFAADREALPALCAGDELDDGLVRDERAPRQFMEIKLNMRCSILFHLLVPGGKCMTEIARPVSFARCWSRRRHRRTR